MKAPHTFHAIIILMLHTHSLSSLFYQCSTPIPCQYYSTYPPHSIPVIIILPMFDTHSSQYYSTNAPHPFRVTNILFLHTHSLSVLFYQSSTHISSHHYSTNAPYPSLSLLIYQCTIPFPCHYSTNAPHPFPAIINLLILHTHSLSLFY